MSDSRNEARREQQADALVGELRRQGAGRLTIFLGAAPGVGKTYTMLARARELAINQDFGAESLDDARIHRLVDQYLATIAVDEEGDRHAPGALARHDPVGPRLDHAAQPVLPRRRH